MKKRISFSALLLGLLFTLGSFTPAENLYIWGPDTRCALQFGIYGNWPIFDYEPGSTFQWYINDAVARDLGYPSYSWGRPVDDTDDTLNHDVYFSTAGSSVSEVIVTCRASAGGVDQYEGFLIADCE